MDPVEVMSAPSWLAPAQAAASAIAGGSIPSEVWRKLLLKHLKVAAFIGGRDGGSQHGGQQYIQDSVQDQHLWHPHPLHCAASQGIVRAGAALLASGPSDVTSVRDASGRTPLHWAAMANHTGFIQILLESGANPNARDFAGRAPLMSCAAFGATKAARLLLQWNADKDGEDGQGLTPLHAAAGGNHVEVAELLLSAGADRQRRTSIGASPRHVAERQGHRAMVSLLIGGGAHNRQESCSRDARLEAEAFSAQYKFEQHTLLQRTRVRR